MNSKAAPFIVLLLLCFLAPLHADTVVLKDGSELSGEILSDSPGEVVIEYQVTASIKDQKSVPRADVVKVIRISEDQKAFAELGELNSPATLLDSSFQDPLLDKKIPAFLARYSYSGNVARVRDAQKTLEEERARLRAGDRKIDGEWIKADQIAADPVQFGARIKLAEIREAVRRNETVQALQAYELFEKAQPSSPLLPDAVDIALRQLDVLQQKVASAKANFDVIDKKRQAEIAAAPADQSKLMLDALAREELAAKTAIRKAETGGEKFFPVFANSKEGLESLQSLITKEKLRLTALQRLPMRESVDAVKEANRLMDAGNRQEAATQIAVAEKAWPANALIPAAKRRLEELSKAAPSPLPAATSASTATPAPSHP